MFDPKPAGSVDIAKPRKILSKKNLLQAWDLSRDSTAHAGTAGIDNETAKHFASNLDANLGEIRSNLTVSTAGKSAQERSEWDDRFMRRVWLRLSSSSRAGADRGFGYCDR